MAHFDLNEQEQIATVKYFWKDWGKYIAAVVVLLILGYVGSTGYNWYNTKQSAKAAQIYAGVITALNNNQDAEVYKITDQLIADLPNTEVTSMSAMQAAKLSFTKKNYAQAEKYLLWTKDKSSDKSLQSLAALRLASVYIDEKKFDKAREMLKVKHDLSFDGLFYEGRGDMYIAMGDLNKARDAYKEGLQKAANDPSTQQAIQMKLDIIGG